MLSWLQIAILASGMALTYQPSSSSAPESSATAAARSQQVTPLNVGSTLPHPASSCLPACVALVLACSHVLAM